MVVKNIIFQNMKMARETPLPPFMANAISNFHLDYLNLSLPCRKKYVTYYDCILQNYLLLMTIENR